MMILFGDPQHLVSSHVMCRRQGAALARFWLRTRVPPRQPCKAARHHSSITDERTIFLSFFTSFLPLFSILSFVDLLLNCALSFSEYSLTEQAKMANFAQRSVPKASTSRTVPASKPRATPPMDDSLFEDINWPEDDEIDYVTRGNEHEPSDHRSGWEAKVR